MGKPKRRRSDRAGRAPMRSPGRPPVARREHRQRFWAAIARGPWWSSGIREYPEPSRGCSGPRRRNALGRLIRHNPLCVRDISSNCVHPIGARPYLLGSEQCRNLPVA
jgi:hypothetical protein